MLNQTKTTETLRLIRCDIADETYGLDMFWVRSIQRIDRLSRNPKAEGPSTSRHGEPVEPSGPSPVGWVPGNEGEIPVFSLASRLGRPSKEGGASQRIIVLNPPLQVGEGERGRPWALLVDRVWRVIQIPADHVVSLPPIVINPSADYFQGVIKLGEELILLLSPERLHPDASLPSSSSLGAGGSKGKTREAPSSGPSPSTGSPTASAESQRRSYGQIVVFSTAEPHPAERALSFGLSISQVPEIIEPLPMIRVPGVPAFVLGLANWRDQPVPVIDLASRLGLAPEMDLSTKERICLIIARDKGHALPVPSPVEGSSSREEPNQGALVGFPVRPAIQILNLPIAHQPCRRTLSLDQTLTRGIVELENETLVIPDLRNILWRDG